MEKCSGGSEILGAHLNIFIELNIDDFPLLLDCIINKRFSSNVKQNGLYFSYEEDLVGTGGPCLT